MFENVGEKIKSWASALFYITTIISIITAIVLWATIEEGEPFYVIGGFIFAILGPLSAWFSSLILYNEYDNILVDIFMKVRTTAG